MSSDNKTKPGTASPRRFIELVEHKGRRDDALVLLDWFTAVTRYPPVMWGESIIGYGSYHYRYESGREGDFLMTGFSPRKAAMSIYILPGYRNMQDKLAQLGKHRLGKSCLYVGRLANIDLHVLEEIVLDGLQYLREHYDCVAPPESR